MIQSTSWSVLQRHCFCFSIDFSRLLIASVCELSGSQSKFHSLSDLNLVPWSPEREGGLAKKAIKCPETLGGYGEAAGQGFNSGCGHYLPRTPRWLIPPYLLQPNGFLAGGRFLPGNLLFSWWAPFKSKAAVNGTVTGCSPWTWWFSLVFADGIPCERRRLADFISLFNELQVFC